MRKLDEYIGQMQHLPSADSVASHATGPTNQSETYDAVIATTPFQETLTLDEMAGYNPNAGILWPGAIIQGKSLGQGTLAPVPVAHGQETISISNVSPDGVDPTTIRYSTTIKEPTFATVDTGRQQLVGQKLKPSAKLTYTMDQLYSLEQGLLKVGMDAHYLSSSVKAQLSSEDYEKKTNLIAKFVQEYYTVSVEPHSGASFFASGVTVDSLTPYSDPVTNPLTYVQGVTYGRMALLIVSSDEKYSDLKQAVEAAYEAGTAGGSGSYDKRKQSIVQHSQMKLLVFGGDPKDAVKVVGADTATALPAFRQWITAAAQTPDIASGVPISYRVNYLKDSQIARLSFTTDYKRVEVSLFPLLVDWKITFRTTKDDKDGDSMLSVSVTGPRGTVADWGQHGEDKWENGSTHEIDLQNRIPLRATDLNRANLRFHLGTNGDDRWDFDFTIEARNTRTGETWSASSGAEWLSDENQTLNKHLPGLNNY